MSLLRRRPKQQDLEHDLELLDEANEQMVDVDVLLGRLDLATSRIERVADRLEGRRPRGNGPGRV